MNKCYLCGSTDNLTRDHIAPKNLFPDPLPTDLITLPCCERCHKPLSLDDEAFRAWVASDNGRSDAGNWIWEHRVVGSSFKRSPKFFENVRKHAEILQLRLPGEPVFVPTLSIPQNRAQTVLIRITKGLLTHFHPDYDFSKDSFRVFCPAPIPQHNESVLGLMKVCKHECRGDGVFDFWHGITVERLGGSWVYFFYQAACCVVVHSSTWKSSDTNEGK